MSRKVISLFEHFGYCFKYHDSKFLEFETKIDGMIQPIGHLDIFWEKEKLPIYLININQRVYYSVIQETTIDMLYDGITNHNIPKEDYDIKIEEKINADLSVEILRLNKELRNKYNEDSNYLNYLGLPDLPEEEKIECEEKIPSDE